MKNRALAKWRRAVQGACRTPGARKHLVHELKTFGVLTTKWEKRITYWGKKINWQGELYA